MRLILTDDDDAEGGSLTHRLHDIWRRHRMPGGETVPVHHQRLGDGNAGGLGNVPRLPLIHGKSGGENTGMGVGNLEILQDTLNSTVLAERTMKRIEGHIGTKIGKDGSNIASHIDARDAIALAF